MALHDHGLDPLIPEAVARWFRQRFGAPTEVQRAAWSHFATGCHLLLSAPTGTGKTLAAFLPILVQLLSRPPGESTSLACLYVTPLKALSNDTARSLTGHFEELAAFVSSETRLPRLAVRTGDTPAKERRALRKQPPDLLLTTPESLAVLLSQSSARDLFADLRWVVIDEVHALAANKRGADLAVSLERLTRLARGRLQRIGLSATATPLQEAAQWLMGGSSGEILQAGTGTPLELTLAPLEDSGHFLATLVDRLKPEVCGNRSTLVFTNTRRLAEQLGWALRRNLPELGDQIAVHHSALAAERRRQVEEDFKHGRLRAVVSSTSLELGIDIGSVDLAVLVHPPGDVIRLLQRVGRSGHGPERVKRGLVLTATEAELLEATVTAVSGQAGQCEPLRIPLHPLDVLCQQILGMAAAGPCSADKMFDLVRGATPYRELSRRDFDDCLAYLTGSEGWLPPRLRWEETQLTILDERTARLLRRNLGTILTEPIYEVRENIPGRERPRAGAAAPLADARGSERTEMPLGQVEQVFAERLQPGDRFLLDGRCLQVRAVRPEDCCLLVEEMVGRPGVPRWGGEGWPLSTELARRLYLLREQAAEALRGGPEELAALLRRDYRLGETAAAILAAYFQRQETVSEIPEAKSCLIEMVAHDQGADYYVHTPLNRPANDALARVAVHRLARQRGLSAASIVADLGFALLIEGGLGTEPAEELRTLLAPENFDVDLDQALEASATLRERFQRVALTGLMLLRQPLGRQRRVGGPDWAARRLFDKVRGRDNEFVLLRQARREVRSDLCDAPTARHYLEELARQPLRCRSLPHPSPFVESWTQMASGPAETVETAAEALRRLHASLFTGTNDARPE
jgi:ATP-dependent Lhr-like helicase